MSLYSRVTLCGVALQEMKFEPIDTVPFVPHRFKLYRHGLVKIRVPNNPNNAGGVESESERYVFIQYGDLGNGDDFPFVSAINWLRQYILNKFPSAQDVHVSSGRYGNKTFQRFVDFFPGFPFVDFIVRYEIDRELHYRFYNVKNMVISHDENNGEWIVLDLEHIPNSVPTGYLDE